MHDVGEAILKDFLMQNPEVYKSLRSFFEKKLAELEKTLGSDYVLEINKKDKNYDLDRECEIHKLENRIRAAGDRRDSEALDRLEAELSALLGEHTPC